MTQGITTKGHAVPRNRLLGLVLVLTAGAVAGLTPDSLGASGEIGEVAVGAAKKTAVVDHVADGDTIQVEINGREEDIRFIGIDTPEVYGGVECGGPEASASMKRMLKPGDRVNLVRDRTQDNRDYYGRLLRYVELDGQDLGRKQLVRAGPRSTSSTSRSAGSGRTEAPSARPARAAEGHGGSAVASIAPEAERQEASPLSDLPLDDLSHRDLESQFPGPAEPKLDFLEPDD